MRRKEKERKLGEKGRKIKKMKQTKNKEKNSIHANICKFEIRTLSSLTSPPPPQMKATHQTLWAHKTRG